MAELPKPTSEVFQFLVRLSDVTKTKIDLNDVAKAMGTKYKAAWDGMNKAKKDLAAAGYVAPPADTLASEDGAPGKNKVKPKNGTTGDDKKRKAAEMSTDTTEGGTGDETMAKKTKRGGPTKAAVKVEETDEAARGGTNSSVVEHKDETIPAVSTVPEKKKRGRPAKVVKSEEGEAGTAGNLNSSVTAGDLNSSVTAGDLNSSVTEQVGEPTGVAPPVTDKKKRRRSATKKPAKSEETKEVLVKVEETDKAAQGGAEVEKTADTMHEGLGTENGVIRDAETMLVDMGVKPLLEESASDA